MGGEGTIGGNDWDSVPNPARNLRFLDFPYRFAAVKIIIP